MLYPNPQIYHHLKTLFVHVPKTAGTSIERHLRQSDKDVVGGHTTALAYREKYPEAFRSYFKFAVVRHPVDRFLSAYRYLREHPVHPALNNQIVHDCDSLEGFMERVRTAPAILDGIVHMLPQHRFVCGANGEILVDAIYRFEDLANAWPEICQRIGIPDQALAKLNQSRPAPADEEATSGVFPFVRKAYERDLDLFGYPSR